MIKLTDNILCWCNNPEDEAVKQAMNLSKHPWLVGNVCLMPDTHAGYGVPIGTVVALEDAVSPNMVGVDISCSVRAVRTSLTDITTEELKKVLGGSKEYKGGIRANIPVGFSHHSKAINLPIFDDDKWNDTIICKEELESAKTQLGTLGGGNHFIEIQKGSDGYIWFMIHSGSRNLGYKVAQYYNNVAIEQCTKWKHHEIVKNDLAVLLRGTKEFDNYMKEMDICKEFAYASRGYMHLQIQKAFQAVFPDIEFPIYYDIPHNYVQLEHHYSRDLFVHRKGATLVRKDMTSIIPGSQGTNSYIVKGLGNEASLQSASHGAGRKMSRRKAQENLNLQDEINKLDNKGILHGIKSKGDLDEASGAYKDIDIVMEEQKDLVEKLVELTPLAVVKG